MRNFEDKWRANASARPLHDDIPTMGIIETKLQFLGSGVALLCVTVKSPGPFIYVRLFNFVSFAPNCKGKDKDKEQKLILLYLIYLLYLYTINIFFFYFLFFKFYSHREKERKNEKQIINLNLRWVVWCGGIWEHEF